MDLEIKNIIYVKTVFAVADIIRYHEDIFRIVELNAIIISVLSLAVVVFALDKFVWTSDEHPAPAEGSETVAALNAGPKKIAVLPFVNMSDDSDQEYFSDGLSEEVLNLLAKIPDLRVTSRSSAFSFKDKEFTIAEVGETLGVDHVLEGSVRRSGNTIRITAQLIEVATDAHQWSDTWDRQFEDVFVIQDEIAAHVVDALRIQLLTDIPKYEVAVPEAHALVLQGSFLFRQGNAPSIRQAIELLEQAVALDPDYSQAWLWLGVVRYVGTSMGVGDRVAALPIKPFTCSSRFFIYVCFSLLIVPAPRRLPNQGFQALRNRTPPKTGSSAFPYFNIPDQG